jgi:protease I
VSIPDVRRIVAHFFDNDLPVGTLCHGPQVPAALGYLQGRKSSGFPPLGPDIEGRGRTPTSRAPTSSTGNMVSAAAGATSPSGRRRSSPRSTALLFPA